MKPRMEKMKISPYHWAKLMINDGEEMDNIALSALRYATDVSFT